MQYVKFVILWIIERVSPSTIQSALAFTHRAIDSLAAAEKKANAKVADIDAQVQSLLDAKASHADVAAQASRVAANLRSLVA